ncbi:MULTISPECIES: protein-export chaperone SecB [Bacillus]|uniref:protein-export chaperone SecB n=1 Tax=Bacillus TaxID=1386 RepID=UPI0011BE900C|nr:MULTISPECIES: protein-export chaperone SecB [Bacillus]MCY8401363.1 protein-export chaperone SecB [Bacillus haynesii]MCY8649008.1 protein-export chaperone SecB [Bacillus haynesii]MCY9413123.1 protein-export chaperone SecB [Bacillus haynesii]
MNTEIYKQYRLAYNSIQLQKVQLESLNCINRGIEEFSEDYELELEFFRKVNLENETEAKISLKAIVGFKEKGPFLLEIIYNGTCSLLDNNEKDNFKDYCNKQVVPLLLPYIREIVSNTLIRMGLPNFTVPTIDIIASYIENEESNSLEED